MTQDPRLFGNAPAGWTFVQTDSVKLLQLHVRHAMERNLIIAAEGVSGSGKSTATRYIASRSTSPVLHIKATNAPGVNGLFRTLLVNKHGLAAAPGHLRRDELMAELSAILRAEPHLIIIDEAARLRTETVEALLMLHDDGLEQFAVLLAGTGIQRRLAKHDHLINRIERTVEFLLPSRTEDLFPLLKQLHPVLAATDDALLERLVMSFGASASLRAWQHLVGTALDYWPDLTRLDEQSAATVLATKGEELR